MPRATCLALLRGINVGGKNKLPMTNLVEIFAESGCNDIRTYIQSGNVIFSASPGVMPRVSEQVTAKIAARFGFRTPVILRTAEQLRDICAHNPFLAAAGANETCLHVMFLAKAPSDADVNNLDLHRSPGDAFTVRDDVVYLHLPNGVAGSKLTNAYFDAKLATISTSRNWRTTTKLLGMMEELA